MVEHRPLRAMSILEGAVEEIREEMIFAADVLLAARVGPWEMHRDAEGLYLSDEWQAILGIEMTSDLVNDYVELLEPDERPEFLDRLETAFQHGVHTPFEFQHHLAGQLVLSRGRVVSPPGSSAPIWCWNRLKTKPELGMQKKGLSLILLGIFEHYVTIKISLTL